MMNRKEFYEYVKDNVKDYLPDSYQNGEIRIEEVAKNNGLRLTGISIPQGDQRAVPMVYLDSLYMEYVNGKNLDSCVGDVADMRIEVQDKAAFINMGLPDILDYEKMKDKLQVRICDREWNEERLADKVVTEHGDFAAYYAVNVEENEGGIGSIPVTVNLMNEWGVTAEQIQADAVAADRNRGVVLMDMNEMIKSMIFGEEAENLLNEKLEIQIKTDALTGAYNRRALNEEIQRLYFETLQNKRHIVVFAMLDVDYFKKYNDHYGHLKGDQILRNLVKVLQNTLPKNAFVARYGGEEFLLLISDSNADAAFELAERFRLQIAGEIGVTISIGIADYRVNDILDEQIVRADTALYKAKHAGRNRAEVE